MANESKKLTVDVIARIDKLEKGMAKASQVANTQFGKIESRAKRMERSLSGIGASAFGGLTKGAIGVLAPLLTAGAAINGAKEALEAFGNIADNAAATGLDAEFFQSLAYQASLGGVSIDQLSGSLATFAKNSGLAAEGKGRMVTALKALDPVLLENIRKATTQEQRVKLVADAMAKTADASKRAAIATSAFGDSGAKLAGIFAGGAAQIDVMTVKARDLGLIVDRELIARADQLGDEFDTTTKIVDLQLKQALVNLGPTLIWLAGLAGGIAEQIGRTVDGLNSLGNQSSGTLEGRLAGIATQLASPQDSPNLSQVGGIDTAAAATEQAAIMAELRKRAIDNLRTQLTNRPPTTGEIPTLEETATRNTAAAAAIRQAESVKALIAQLEFEKSLVGASETDMAVANALRQAGAGATDEQKVKIESLVVSLGAERAAIEANAEAMEAFGAAAQGALGTFINDMIEGKSIAESFGGILKSLGGQLINAGLGSLFGGGGLFGIPGRAAGGPVSAGQPYVVGEKRPELFIPSTAGRIIPHVPSMPQGGGGGGGVSVPIVINVDATGADPAGLARVQAQLGQMKAELPSRVIRAVRQARSARMI